MLRVARVEAGRLVIRMIAVISQEIVRSWNIGEVAVEAAAGERWWHSGCFLKGEPVGFAMNLIWSMREVKDGSSFGPEQLWK